MAYDINVIQPHIIGVFRVVIFHLCCINIHCVPRALVRKVSSRFYLFTYCFNTYKTMHFTRFRHLNLNAALRIDETR